MQIVNTFINFFSEKDYQNKLSMNVKDFSKIILSKIFLAFSLAFIANIILYAMNFKKISPTDTNRGILEIYYLSVIIAPLMEELFFRLPLLGVSMVFKEYKTLVMCMYVFTSIVFGLAHVSNYDNTDLSIIEMVLITLPQIGAGFILGWICLKYNYGLMWSMLAHATFNFIVITLSILL